MRRARAPWRRERQPCAPRSRPQGADAQAAAGSGEPCSGSPSRRSSCSCGPATQACRSCRIPLPLRRRGRLGQRVQWVDCGRRQHRARRDGRGARRRAVPLRQAACPVRKARPQAEGPEHSCALSREGNALYQCLDFSDALFSFQILVQCCPCLGNQLLIRRVPPVVQA